MYKTIKSNPLMYYCADALRIRNAQHQNSQKASHSDLMYQTFASNVKAHQTLPTLFHTSYTEQPRHIIILKLQDII